MMNNPMDESKESFIYSNLLPYLLYQLEHVKADDRDEVLNKIVTLKVFPYIKGNSVGYGALKENGVDWYYIPKGYNKTVDSTESYRILCTKKMDQRLSEKFLAVFGTLFSLLHPYSDDEVIDRLVSQMRNETTFSNTWWQKAKEAYCLWNGRDPGDRFCDASANKADAVILYSDDYCSQYYQQQLQARGILSDIKLYPGYLCDIGVQGVRSVILSSTLPDSQLWGREQHRQISFMSEEDQLAIRDAEGKGVFDGEDFKRATEHFMLRHCGGHYSEDSPECLTRQKKSGMESYETAWGPSEFCPLGTLKDWNYTDKLGRITIPALIVSGTNDLCTPLIAKTMADRIPNSRWELYENCRHNCFAEATDRYLTMARAWLEQND